MAFAMAQAAKTSIANANRSDELSASAGLGVPLFQLDQNPDAAKASAPKATAIHNANVTYIAIIPFQRLY